MSSSGGGDYGDGHHHHQIPYPDYEQRSINGTPLSRNTGLRSLKVKSTSSSSRHNHQANNTATISSSAVHHHHSLHYPNYGMV